MRAARIDHQVGVEVPSRLVVACEHVHPCAISPRLSGGAERGHLGAFQKGHVGQVPAQFADSALDQCPARVELP